MNRKVTLLVVLISVSALLIQKLDSTVSKKKAAVQEDENEFSEFDDEFEEPESATKLKSATSSSPSSTPSAKKPVVDVEDDFDEETIEDVPPVQSSPKTPSSAKKEASSTLPVTPVARTSSDFGVDELDLEEFENFADDDEFETTSTATTSPSDDEQKPKPKQESKGMPNLKIADVPQHLMSTGNWQNYVWEICMLCIILVYMVNFFYGKSKNYTLVNHWYQTNRALLEKSFAVVGDDGMSPDVPSSDENETGKLIKDSESSYALWCTGRHGCEGMLMQLKLIKRQDFVNGVLMQLMKPQCDQLVISAEYAQQDDLDSFVFCLCARKSASQVLADYQDVSTYCVEKKLGQGASIVDAGKYTEMLTSSVCNKYVMLNEIGEVPGLVLDKTVCAFLNKYPDMVEYLLISDQFIGYKSQVSEDTQSSPSASSSSASGTDSKSCGIPKSRPIMLLCLNIGTRGSLTGATLDDMERMQPALQLAIYLGDKAPHLRLSKEAKSKALRKRAAVAEQYMKLTHKQRQEAVMQRKEEKRRAEKERIMNESDPEKQKKLEEKELKREKRKNMSKIKQIKIKAM